MTLKHTDSDLSAALDLDELQRRMKDASPDTPIIGTEVSELLRLARLGQSHEARLIEQERDVLLRERDAAREERDYHQRQCARCSDDNVALSRLRHEAEAKVSAALAKGREEGIAAALQACEGEKSGLRKVVDGCCLATICWAQDKIRALSPSSPGEPAGSGWQLTSADDIRAAGWSVAVHNDYRQDGKAHTFWLFVKEGQAVKGEGETDFAALEQVRAQIDLLPAPPHEPTGRENSDG